MLVISLESFFPPENPSRGDGKTIRQNRVLNDAKTHLIEEDNEKGRQRPKPSTFFPPISWTYVFVVNLMIPQQASEHFGVTAALAVLLALCMTERVARSCRSQHESV